MFDIRYYYRVLVAFFDFICNFAGEFGKKCLRLNERIPASAAAFCAAV